MICCVFFFGVVVISIRILLFILIHSPVWIGGESCGVIVVLVVIVIEVVILSLQLLELIPPVPFSVCE